MLLLVVVVEIIMLVVVSYFVFTCGICNKVKEEMKQDPVPDVQILHAVTSKRESVNHVSQECEEKKSEISKSVNEIQKSSNVCTNDPSFVEVAQLNLKCAIKKTLNTVPPTPAVQNPPVSNMEITALQEVDMNAAKISQTAIQAESLISGKVEVKKSEKIDKNEMEFASVGKSKEMNIENELIIYDKPKQIK
ncbi:hypothetical protein T12_16588 [Trichinella patagoniensis]|uniref:Uncharacterized protein n=1 Tax=Trichinella patagoniensis TaxID=990121 RepID=A0A0V1A493_9BILA|nr:hypothetical protein T12_16588 [Trichinella patagoniensis]